MGLFWDLIQDSKIREEQNRNATLEVRVAELEAEVAHLQRTQRKLLTVLEKLHSEDIDGDGYIG